MTKKNINKDYVSIEQAKKLKEIGFPQQKYFGFVFHIPSDTIYPTDRRCSKLCCRISPLYLVQQWLRDEKKMYLDVISETNGTWENGVIYDYSIMSENSPTIFSEIPYDSYEKCLAAGISNALKIIGEKNQ